MVFRHPFWRTVNGYGIYPVFFIARTKELNLFGARFERFTLMNSMAVTDNILNPVVLERFGNLRQFLQLSLSKIFNRKVEMFP